MSKYDSLWEYVRDNGNSSLKMTFEQIQQITGIPIDHSFLKYKKELTEYGYKVEKISMIFSENLKRSLKNIYNPIFGS